MDSATLVNNQLISHNGHSTERTGPLLVKLGGAAIDQADENPALFESLCELHKTLGAQGDGVVLIHGGGAAVDRRLERLGLVSQRRDGIRLTPSDQIDEVVAALAGSVNKQVVGLIQRCGVPATGLCLGDGFIARSSKATGYTFDPGHVGQICGGEPRLIHLLIDAGYMPVLCSIGLDDDGQPLNINADDAAAGLASLIGCRGLVLLTDVPGVLDREGQLLSELDAEEIEQRIGDGSIRGGMIPKVRGALRAAQVSHAPVMIMSWNDPAALLNFGRGESAGTRIVSRNGVSVAAADNECVGTPWSDLL